MSRPDLFPATKPPRAKRRVLMHMTDAGEFPDGKTCGKYHCDRCGADTGWVYTSFTELRRGIPCLDCNPHLGNEVVMHEMVTMRVTRGCA